MIYCRALELYILLYCMPSFPPPLMEDLICYFSIFTVNVKFARADEQSFS